MSKIQTAIIAVANNRFPIQAELFDYLSQHGDIKSFENVNADEYKLTFRDGSATYAITLIEDKIPTDVLRGPCALSWHWPEAALEFSKHTSHFVVGVLNESADALDVALRLTHLTAAICNNSGLNPIGVLWSGGKADNQGASGSVHQPQEFVAHSDGISRDVLPLELWISFIPIASDKHPFIMTTRGLDAFGLKELETTGQGQAPQWVYEHLFNFAHFCLTHPEEVKENQTIGMSNDEKIDILSASSRLDPNKDVLMLNFDTIETNRQLEKERQDLPGQELDINSIKTSSVEKTSDELPVF